LNINPSSGAITPNTSFPGTYTVTYTTPATYPCAAVSNTTSVTITAAPSATIIYPSSPFCKTLGVQSVTQTGTSGGSYSSSPAGLIINASTGAITPSSSTAGTYTVIYTLAAAGGCSAVIAQASVIITALPSATISYPSSPFCKTLTSAQPVTRIGTSGGSYSSSPTGLIINASTGAITPSSSIAGTYTVIYTLAAAGGCAAVSTTTSVTITTAPSAAINYPSSPFCKTLTSAQPVTRTGTSGGSYSSSPTGLIINASTGAITPSSSTAGTYTVIYTLAAAGGCAAVSTTTSVTISTAPSATISYPSSAFCKTLTSAQSATRIGTSGGSYSSSPTGLIINASTGAITPSSSTAGTYTVIYTIAAAGVCSAVSTTTSVTITTAPSATISYPSSPFCKTLTSAQPVTRTGTSGGAYSSSPTGLIINASTGAITPSSSIAGTYTVIYTLAAGGCAAVSTTTNVTITTAPSATISYPSSPFCKTLTSAQPVTRTGTSGGSYSSSPTGLIINASTGAITPSSSTAGTYTVIYTIAAAGICSSVITTTSVTIRTAPSATISYPSSPFCKTLTSAQPVTRIGTSGGSYSSSPTGLIINASSGAITPSTSTAGTYTVIYTLAAAGGCAAVSTTTSVTITTAPSATISYPSSPFCKTLTSAQPVTRTGTSGGSYSSSPTGLIINASTGAITPSSSTAGTYTVIYTIAAAGICSSVITTTSVTIRTAPSATINYPSSPFCKTLTSAQPVTRIGTSGGSYSSSPTGLSIIATTGAITPSSSIAGTYTVVYTIGAAGGCSAVSTTTSVTITTAPSATISYPSSPFCNILSSAQPVTRIGTSGGSYSASPAGLLINPSTGAITPNLSSIGNYTVNYTIAAAGTCSAVSTTTSVVIGNNCQGMIVNNTISEHISPVEIEELAIEGSSSTLINQAIPMWKVLFDRNPFESSFKLSIENEISSNLEVQILNSAGLLLSTRSLRIEDLKDTQFGEDLTPGIYLVLVKQGNNRQTLRMIKY
jgi:hypothetical protein